MTVSEAISQAEAILPGTPAPDEENDPRWQAIIAVGQFIETESDAVWFFVSRWGDHTQADLRTAIATCLLEHLLEVDFETYFPRAALLANNSPRFADTLSTCWPSDLPPQHQQSFKAYVAGWHGGA